MLPVQRGFDDNLSSVVTVIVEGDNAIATLAKCSEWRKKPLNIGLFDRVLTLSASFHWLHLKGRKRYFVTPEASVDARMLGRGRVRVRDNPVHVGAEWAWARWVVAVTWRCTEAVERDTPMLKAVLVPTWMHSG